MGIVGKGVIDAKITEKKSRFKGKDLEGDLD